MKGRAAEAWSFSGRLIKFDLQIAPSKNLMRICLGPKIIPQTPNVSRHANSSRSHNRLARITWLPVPFAKMIFVENETASQLYPMSKINKVPSKKSSHRVFLFKCLQPRICV